MTTTSAQATFERVRAFFTEEGWGVHEHPDGPTLAMNFKGNTATWMCMAQVSEPLQVFRFYSIAPVTCPEPRRQVMAELLNIANFGFAYGAFEMDPADGEVRFRVGLPIESLELTRDGLAELVAYNCGVFDEVLRGIFGVILQGMTAQQAMALVGPTP